MPRLHNGFLLLLPTVALALGAAAPPRADSTRAAPAPVAFTKHVFATAQDIPCPVAFAIDDRGVVWTANSLRYDGHGLFDNRQYPIVPDDVTSTSVSDRRRLTEKWVHEGKLDTKEQKVTLPWLANFSEQVRRLEDTDGDGRADRVSVAADGMNDLVQGGAAGVLPWGDAVYATIIPDLWMLRDSAGTGRWSRTSLQTGFGVHMGQAGHDMHGLVMGNDGRLYWSIADRGYDITTREGAHLSGHSGAVFRCWPDGRGLERFAQGLRNPQELAFNDAGDLFTGDNNADVGDRARLMYVPRGADAGWLFYLQYVRGCGAWTREHMWEKRLEGNDPAQPAWTLLPADYLSTCPSGVASYPGTGLPARYAGSIWAVDYLSGVQAFRPVPDGAGYAMQDWHWAYRDSWGMSDVDFGPDGKVWVLYWGESWHRNDKSRLVSLTPDPTGVDTAAVAEVRTLLRDGFGSLADARLRGLLGHADRRVRQRASFELAHRGRDRVLADALAHDPRVPARLHALWGLGIVARTTGAAAVEPALLSALADTAADVRRVAAITLGEIGAQGAGPALVARLRDPSSRVRFGAAQAIAGLREPQAFAPLVQALADDADADATLRSAYARALAVCATSMQLGGLAGSPDRAVRLGAVLALREAQAEEIAPYLHDPDPQVATEAARAAYDLQLSGAMTALAATLPGLRADLRTEPYVRRALHAALRVGGATQAEAVAAFAADSTVSDTWRDQALQVLTQWDRPDARDGVLARWLPLPPRAPGVAHAAIVAHMPAILRNARGDDLAGAVELARRAGFSLPDPLLAAWTADSLLDEHARIYALRWLDARRSPVAQTAIDAALSSTSDSLFEAGFALRAAHDPARARAAAMRVSADPHAALRVRQSALRLLGKSPTPATVAFLTARVAELRRGTLDSALALDLGAAARAAGSPALRAAAHVAVAPPRGTRDSLAALWPVLHGGDATRGKAVFENLASAQCVRCHAIDGAGGSAGPDLSLVGAHDNRYLLEALVAPNARLAPGFATVTLTLTDGSSVTGTLKQETAQQLVLLVDDQRQTIERSRVRTRSAGGSIMPPMGGVLQPAELRDVIAYLTTRRDADPELPLSAFAPLVSRDAAGAFVRDRSADGRPLHIGGAAFAQGVGVRAPSRLVYGVPPGARAFVARVGLDDASPGGLVGFEVRVDGRNAWTSAPLKFGQIAHAFATLPPGARVIELIVNDGGNGIANDVADWAGAGFVR